MLTRISRAWDPIEKRTLVTSSTSREEHKSVLHVTAGISPHLCDTHRTTERPERSRSNMYHVSCFFSSDRVKVVFSRWSVQRCSIRNRNCMCLLGFYDKGKTEREQTRRDECTRALQGLCSP